MTEPNENFTHLDICFAEFICKIAGANASPLLQETVMQLTAAIRNGASCLHIQSPETRSALLAAYPAVGVFEEHHYTCPLLIENDRLYLQKMLHYEQVLAERLLQANPQEPLTLPEDRLDEVFSTLSPENAEEERAIKIQKDAVRNALSRNISIISGGPGTGKTTVASALLYHELLRNPAPAIAIAAPTGKAHARLQESLCQDSQKFNIPPEYRKKIEELPGGTINLLLKDGKKGFKYNAQNQLKEYDFLLVDECSMISLELMTALFQALPPNVRICLLGDHAQLASVDAGSVFSDLCYAAENADPESPLYGMVRKLSYNFRAKSAPALVNLSDHLRRGILPEAQEIQSPVDRKKLIPALETAVEHFGKVAELCRENTPDSRKKAFELLDSFRIICALRGTVPYGVNGVNQALLQKLKLSENSPGVPIMIRKNDYAQQLFNGDTGLITPGQLVYFPNRETPVNLQLLPEHDVAFAMTAHQSQGSGFDEVLLLLPANESAIVTRELIYTAVTRARKNIIIRGDREQICKALSKTTCRAGGLSEKLHSVPLPGKNRSSHPDNG